MAEHPAPEKTLVAEDKSSSTQDPRAESPDVDEVGDAKGDVEKHMPSATDGTLKETGAATESEIDPNIVDYDGPDDPYNPYNWKKSRKWVNGGFLSALTFIT